MRGGLYDFHNCAALLEVSCSMATVCNVYMTSKTVLHYLRCPLAWPQYAMFVRRGCRVRYGGYVTCSFTQNLMWR